MGKVLLFIVSGLILLIAVVLIKALRFTSRQVRVDGASQMAGNGERIVERLAKSIRFQTVSYQEPAQFDSKEFLGLHAYLEEAFPRVHATLTKEVVGNYSLLYTWKGSVPELKPILLMAHIDVVPVEPGTEDEWAYPPFGGRIADGYIWGRGAMDDKLRVLGILEAVETLLGEGIQPRRTIYLAFGHDEEVGGARGATRLAALLQSRGIQLEYVLDEGLVITEGILPGVSAPVALVGIAEKGFVNIEFTVQSEGGHASMPPPRTAVGTLSAAIHKLEEHPVPGKMEGPVRQMFASVGPEMSFVKRMVFANLWLFGGLVERQLAASPATNALIRTTLAATMFEGGIKANVLPIEARAVVNARILPGDSIAGVIDHIRKTIADPRIKVIPLHDSFSEPTAVSNIESPNFEMLQRTIRQVFPEVVVAPSLVLAATDSRHYATLTDSIYRFVPMRLGPTDIRRIHGTDERISVENYAQIVGFYVQFIRNSAL